MIYRILTEDKNRAEITRIVDSHFSGYTIIPASGRWENQSEPSLVIEIDGNYPRALIRTTAREIRDANKQQAVMIQVIAAESELI